MVPYPLLQTELGPWLCYCCLVESHLRSKAGYDNVMYLSNNVNLSPLNTEENIILIEIAAPSGKRNLLKAQAFVSNNDDQEALKNSEISVSDIVGIRPQFMLQFIQ